MAQPVVALMFVNVGTTRKASEICQFIIYKVKHKLDVVVIQSEEFKTYKEVKCFLNKKKINKKERERLLSNHFIFLIESGLFR